MDRAGWHKTDKLKLPNNLSIILLPSHSPSNTVFEDYDAILNAGCNAWNKLIDQPETIMSIGLRDWVYGGQ